MIQETQRPRLTFRWIKSNLRMGTELWGVRCLWGAEVLSLQSCPIQLCVCEYTHTPDIFFWSFWRATLNPGEGEEFENSYFSLQNSYSGLREPDCSLGQQVLEKMVANMREHSMTWQKHDSESISILLFMGWAGDTQQCLPAQFRNSGWGGWFGGGR